MNFDEMINRLDALSGIELKMLREELEIKWGVKADVVALSQQSNEAPKPIDKVEQTEFNVLLTGFGANKMGVIRLFRELTGQSLAECKVAVETATIATPKEIKSGVPRETADDIKSRIEVVGGSVEIR